MKKFLLILLSIFTFNNNIYAKEANMNKSLVVYFSRSGNQYNGNVKKGNTAIVADIIANEVNGDKFEIQLQNDNYPDDYEQMTEVAKKELKEQIRPQIKPFDGNIDDYDTVFIGYPIWWGDMPMAVYSFLEEYDLKDKTIVPFCTHGGSGLSGTDRNIKDATSSSSVLKGLALYGSDTQSDFDGTQKKVKNWLKNIGLKNE